MNVNMITCGGQATIPMVAAVSQAAVVRRGVVRRDRRLGLDRSPGPGTRANIDEFTRTTARGVGEIGGAEQEAIIILNPAEPPMIMRDTIFCAVPPDTDRGDPQSVFAMGRPCRSTCPATTCCRSRSSTTLARHLAAGRVSVFVEVEGAGRLPAAVLRQPRHHDRRHGSRRQNIARSILSEA